MNMWWPSFVAVGIMLAVLFLGVGLAKLGTVRGHDVFGFCIDRLGSLGGVSLVLFTGWVRQWSWTERLVLLVLAVAMAEAVMVVERRRHPLRKRRAR